MDCVTTRTNRLPDASGKTCRPGTTRQVYTNQTLSTRMSCASPTIAQMPFDPQAYDLSIASATMGDLFYEGMARTVGM